MTFCNDGGEVGEEVDFDGGKLHGEAVRQLSGAGLVGEREHDGAHEQERARAEESR